MEDEPIVNSSQQQINEVKENGKEKCVTWAMTIVTKSLPIQKQKKFLQRFGSTWDGIKHQDIEELQERYGRNKIMNEKSFTVCDFFYKIVYHAVYFGVISTSHDFIFLQNMSMLAPEEKDVTGVLIMLAMVILSGTMSFCSISQIKQCS